MCPEISKQWHLYTPQSQKHTSFIAYYGPKRWWMVLTTEQYGNITTCKIE